MAAGAGVAATVAGAGCGASPLRVKIRGGARVARGDVELLNDLLDLEYHAIAAYTAGIPLLDYQEGKAAKQFLGQELAHAVELGDLVMHAKGKPGKPRASYDLGNPRSARDVLLLLHRLESAQLTAYLLKIPRLAPGRVRAAVSAIFANDAQHVAVIRSQLGRAPAPSPFVTGAE